MHRDFQKTILELQLPICDRHRDDGEPLSRVCLLPSCTNYLRPTCGQCESSADHKSQQHPQHSFKSLKAFVKSLVELESEEEQKCEQPDNASLQMASKIKQIVKEMIVLSDALKSEAQQIENRLMEYLK